MSAQLARWRADFKIIYRDVQDLAEQRDVYREVMQIATANEQLADLDSRFFYWFGRMHSGAAAVAVRKQLDTDPRVVSLRRLLDAIAQRPGGFTRAAFIARAADGMTVQTERDQLLLRELEHWHEEAFDDIAGTGKPALTRDVVMADVGRLKAAAKRVEHFVNTEIAHRQRRAEELAVGADSVPTWDDLDGAIDLVMELVRKYNRVLGAGEAPGIVPVYQWNWKAVFRVPWLPPHRSRSRSEVTK